jgi:RNA polymerase sigma-70 factor (ECF subfamily)
VTHSAAAETRDGATAADDALAAVFRLEAARLTASVVRLVGDVGVAEEIVGDTLVLAVERWRRAGIPPNPGGWLALTARRRAIDRFRRDRSYAAKVAALERMPPSAASEPDDRLRLIFTCCHPALAPEARVALTLQAVLGFTVADIAAAFVVSEGAVAQRLSRARRRLSEAGIPFRIPREADLDERLASVLAVLYLAFTEGDFASHGEEVRRRDIAEDAAWLGGLLVELLPGEPEPLGLLALMRLNLARAESRVDRDGHLVLLRDQDRTTWDEEAIRGAIALLERAAAMRRTGPYQLQAAIAACHAEAPSWNETDWVQIVVLYDRLLERWPSPVARLNRAIALREVGGAEAALAEVDAVAAELDGYHLLHATRGELLREVGRDDDARAAERTALALTGNPGERSLLEERLSWTEES